MQLRIVIAAAAIIILGKISWAHAAASGLTPLQTVDRVDLSRYLGRWYEIARLPNRFQKGCEGSTAEYALRGDGDIDVTNSCRDAKDGSVRQAKGRAWSVDPDGNSRLKVSFFWPFRGDYWIIELGNEYQYAVVGTPDRKYLWILSRTATMDYDLFTDILQRARQKGFDSDNVLREPANIRLKGAP